jgi:membrane-associated phospholipid phosphatase
MQSPPLPDATTDSTAGAPGRQPAGPRPLWRFVAATILSGALLATVYAVFVLTEEGQRVENLGLAGAALGDSLVRADFLSRLSLISVVSFGAAILAVTGFAAMRGLGWLAAAAGVTMVGSVVTAEILKEVLPRPELVEGPAWLLRNTFPSGHATVAAAIGIGALMVVPGRLRWLALPAAAVFIAVVGQATQAAGWHRMSGVVGGVLLVVTFACASLAALARYGLVAPDEGGRVHRRVHHGLLLCAAAAFGLAALMAPLVVLFPVLRVPEGADGAFVHVGLAVAGIGATILVVDAFGRLIEPYALGRRPPAEADARQRTEAAGPA